ncbi:MAG: TRAP transporter large permease [Deltaproteobacteria bacterium]|nr:TRAP transporter large permease [Deltaproteobacteria bacterium]
MNSVETGVWGLTILGLAVFLFRMPISMALGVVGLGGIWCLSGPAKAMDVVTISILDTSSLNRMTAIPVFVLLGSVCFYSGLNKRFFDSAQKWLGHIRGGAAMAAVLSSAGYSSICSTGPAAAAAMGAAALPEMKQLKYPIFLSTSSVAGGTILGAILPPSLILLVIGLQSDQSIGRLFMGGLVPGLILLAMFVLIIPIGCQDQLGWSQVKPKVDRIDRILTMANWIELEIILIVLIMGLWFGRLTITETGAGAAVLVILLNVLFRTLSWKQFACSLMDTVRISSMIILLLVGVTIFSRFLGMTGLPQALVRLATELRVPSWLILADIGIVFLVGGLVMDEMAFLLITFPFFLPIITRLGYDPIWFSLVMVMVSKIGAFVPLPGSNMFVVAAVSRTASPLEVFHGMKLFFVPFILCLIVITVFPQVVLFLPSFIK